MRTAIEVADLAYRYPRAEALAVDGMTFAVEPGEVFGFLGPSGAGKTTAQRAVLGLVDGWEGRIRLLDRDRRWWGRDLHDRIGVSFELPVGYPRLTAREDLTHFANLHRRAGRGVADVLGAVGLGDAADEPVGSFSKGMRARLNLARAIQHEPELLFLDEPTSGLDPVNAAEVRALVHAEQARGATIFLTTHDMATAASVCDRVAFVVGGRIVACDTPRALQLDHGERRLRVEYRVGGEVHVAALSLEEAARQLAGLPEGAIVETVHTTEASLDDVFRAVTGHAL
ncbi:ABC transporter ATP-binding protein [Egibacter rhizosphaerae]|uniref:ABC transporter ATP-binding protein n=1 Tax=Egibacter rhizosphaerae TaxID=1670831 RepID=UPI003B82FA5A